MDIEILNKILNYIPEVVLDVYLPVELRHFPYYSKEKGIPFVPRNNANAEGRVDLENNISIPYETSSPVEIVHALGNVVTRLFKYMFDGIYDNKTKDRINFLMNGYRHRHFGCETDFDFCGIPRNILEKAQMRLEELKQCRGQLKHLVDITVCLFEKKGSSPRGTTIHDEVSIAFVIIPYLFYDSIGTDPKIWSIVNFFGAVSSFFNYCGCAEEAKYYQRIISISKFTLQMHVPPSLPTVSFHIFEHLDYSYENCGPFAETNAYPLEGLFLKFRKNNTGGKDRIKTVFNRKLYRLAGNLMACKKQVHNTIYKMEYLDSNSRIAILLDSSNIYVIKKRAFLNYMSDRVFIDQDDWVLLTFTDLELSEGGISYDHYSYRDSRNYFRNSLWLTNDREVEKFVAYHHKERNFELNTWTTLFLSSFSYDFTYRSIQKELSVLTTTDFDNSKFAIVYTSNNRIHLFMICGYIAFQDNNKSLYINAIASPIPIKQILPLIDSCCNFVIDLEQLKSYPQSFTLISFHRLHFQELVFIPLSSTLLYGGLNSQITRQFTLLPSVMLPIKTETV